MAGAGPGPAVRTRPRAPGPRGPQPRLLESLHPSPLDFFRGQHRDANVCPSHKSLPLGSLLSGLFTLTSCFSLPARAEAGSCSGPFRPGAGGATSPSFGAAPCYCA